MGVKSAWFTPLLEFHTHTHTGTHNNTQYSNTSNASNQAHRTMRMAWRGVEWLGISYSGRARGSRGQHPRNDFEEAQERLTKKKYVWRSLWYGKRKAPNQNSKKFCWNGRGKKEEGVKITPAGQQPVPGKSALSAAGFTGKNSCDWPSNPKPI